MKLGLKSPVLAAITIAVGLIVLLGYFIQWPILISLRIVFLRWAVILASVAVLVGLINLLRVHWNKIKTGQSGRGYSFILIVSMVSTLAIVGFFGPTSNQSLAIFNYVLIPVESSLMALLAIILASACARLLNRRMNVFSLIFIGTVLFMLVGMVSLPGLDVPLLREGRAWIAQVLASAGARGILLGVGLGTVATGLRILMGVDRPYGG